MTTSIEWTDATWNPTVGCTRVSKGCEHCYAERVARSGLGGIPIVRDESVPYPNVKIDRRSDDETEENQP